MSGFLALAAAAQVAVVGAHGPELRDLPPRAERVAVAVEPKAAEPDCLKTSRIVHYTGAALDVATTIAALEGNSRLSEANPIVKGLFGPRPSPLALIGTKAVMTFGIRQFDEYLVRKGAAKHACTLNFGFGAAGLAAAGLNARFVF